MMIRWDDLIKGAQTRNPDIIHELYIYETST